MEDQTCKKSIKKNKKYANKNNEIIQNKGKNKIQKIINKRKK